jgi:O-antigen/teichoic acid export membrane protein
MARLRRVFLAGYAFLASSMEQIASFLITMLAGVFLLPAEYGVYTLGVVFIGLIQALAYTGFYHFVVNSNEDDESVLSTTFWIILGLSTAASILLLVAAVPIGLLYRTPEIGTVIILLALVQPVAGANAWHSAALLRHRQVNLNFTISLLASGAALLGGAAFLWLWQSIYALVAYRYLRVLTAAGLYLLLSRARPTFTFDRLLARRATGFSGGLYGARFLNFLSQYSADLLLGLMFTTAEAGLFRFGSRIAAGATDIVSLPMRSFTLTQFGHAARRGGDLAHLLERFTGSITLLTGGVTAVIVVFADDAIAAFFDPAYEAAFVIAAAVALRGTLGIGRLLLTPVLSARNQTGAVMTFGLIWTVIGIAAIFLSAPLGLDVLAWTTAAVSAASTVWAFRLIGRKGGIAIGGALRALAVAGALTIGYGVAISQCAALIAVATDLSPEAELGLGLATATLLAVPTVFIGWRLRVFSLHAFSG